MRRRLIIFFAIACVIGAGIVSVSITHKSAKADSISTMLSASAYGLNILTTNGSTILENGPIGAISTDCSPYPINQHSTALSVDLFHGLISSTTIEGNLTFTHADYLSTAVATSQVKRLIIGKGLLGPLVEVDGLHAEAHSTAKIGEASSDTSFSYFGAIKIAGMHLPLNIPANDRIVLPGLGSIVLNEQIIKNINPTTSYAEVNMVDITLGVGNILGQAIGTRILIGHAISSDSDVSVLAALHSHASGLYGAVAAKNITKIEVGPLPTTEIGCTGGTNSATAFHLYTPLLVDAGLADTQVSGLITPQLVTTSSTENITDLSLLNGLIQAQVLNENAYASFDGSKGTGLGDLTVAGLIVAGAHIIPDVHAGNDKINLPGLGYLIIGERIPSAYTYGYAINALDLYVTTPNHLNLAVGLQIIVGHVDAGIAVFH